MKHSDHDPAGVQWTGNGPGVWLEGDEPRSKGQRRLSRRATTLLASVVTLAAIGVPVGLLVSSGANTPLAAPASHRTKPSIAAKLGNGPAEHRVLSALSATTASGNFAFSYHLTESPSTSSAPLTTVPCSYPEFNGTAIRGSSPAVTIIQSEPATIPGMPFTTAGPTDVTVPSPPPSQIQRNCAPAGPQNVSVSGQGVIDVAPMAMAASADVSSFGNLSIRVDSTDVWELSAGDSGLAPAAGDNASAGMSLPGFAGLVEGTLGQREGAMAMLGMASPNGFLDLSQQAVTGAAQVGSGTVDGTPVTEYDVAIDLAQLAQAEGASNAETQAITSAVVLLNQEGYTGTKVDVAIDGAGFIREVKPVAMFADGGTVTLDATFSNFGCAGTVLMPGQQGSTATTTACSSPDTTTTTVAPTTTTTVGTPPGSVTTEAPTTTTGPAPTTTGGG